MQRHRGPVLFSRDERKRHQRQNAQVPDQWHLLCFAVKVRVSSVGVSPVVTQNVPWLCFGCMQRFQCSRVSKLLWHVLIERGLCSGRRGSAEACPQEPSAKTGICDVSRFASNNKAKQSGPRRHSTRAHQAGSSMTQTSERHTFPTQRLCFFFPSQWLRMFS